MKTKALFFSALMGLTLVSCGEAPQGEKAEAKEAVETSMEENSEAIAYRVDTEGSTIQWEGSKLVGDRHVGTIALQEGELKVKDGQLVGGKFTLDMNSINDQDLEGAKKKKLETHLKSGDFFEVEKFPTGTFEIVAVDAVGDNPDATHEITGNLTLKGITKSITIPAQVTFNERGIAATTPQFTIDRTQWDVIFNAGALGTAKDKIIRDEVGLKIDLMAVQPEAVQ